MRRIKTTMTGKILERSPLKHHFVRCASSLAPASVILGATSTQLENFGRLVEALYEGMRHTTFQLKRQILLKFNSQNCVFQPVMNWSHCLRISLLQMTNLMHSILSCSVRKQSLLHCGKSSSWPSSYPMAMQLLRVDSASTMTCWLKIFWKNH